MNSFQQDLACSIKAIGPQGQIPNGGSAAVSAHGGATVEFWAKNNALVPGKFMWKGVVYRDGQKVQPDPPAAWITLKAGELRKVGTQQVAFGYPSSQIEARMLVDIGNFIDETNESNNKANLKFTGSVIG